ncbi:MAG: hypothetical protein ABSC29_02005 [Minisyncoccia bacterium]|jgi:3D (Asp-Asp-Asp) domain-containing protein
MKKLIRRVCVFATIAATFAATFVPAIIKADYVAPQVGGATSQASASVASVTAGTLAEAAGPAFSLYLRVTAYSSSPDETDSTPSITANGMHVRDGIVASNFFPFGTKIKIPSLFGNKVFTVEDRMNRRMKDVVDIWMPTKAAALKFGVSYADVVIVVDKALSRK